MPGFPPLIDQHCHGVLRSGPDRAAFETYLTEANVPPPPASPPSGVPRATALSPAPGASGPPFSYFDTQLGFALRRWCAPVLDLEPRCPPGVYLERRAELGTAEVTRRMLRASGISTFLVDTGLPGRLLTPGELAETAGAEAHEIVRLERLAERAADTARDTHAFLAELSDGVRESVRAARGFKSVVAYRIGLDFDPGPPGTSEIYSAAERWLTSRVPGGRLSDPVLLRHLLWSAVRTGLPLQLHTGFGDPDLRLDRCDPLLLTDFIRATAPYGTPLVLLHCYPYHRGAGYLAAVFPHVYADFGLSLSHTGARARDVLAELLELAPFGKLLFSTGAYGLPELYVVGAELFREAMTDLTRVWTERGEWSHEDARRVTAILANGTAARLYGL
ncbi:amidohydrolase family protein [Streptomyces sp. NBC_01795]|uniref:amidohydrolase family protein n=1 Tax=unclassified Streptomyces TaxID=2593676 RepID=UPI002DD7D1A6|nr:MULTISPECIES: amidohydrolase family protein [unclassified Streptomyces]WSA91016.1 amidohydrolase family protein [Streptomyces sp. NBC_01795]WSB75340.1 amidohydrolase family protein [Streptomyces sp. NBC_01775]WSS16377.1 amidohydrolase family protein [Streptomyces sp. NBC_01186]